MSNCHRQAAIDGVVDGVCIREHLEQICIIARGSSMICERKNEKTEKFTHPDRFDSSKPSSPALQQLRIDDLTSLESSPAEFTSRRIPRSQDASLTSDRVRNDGGRRLERRPVEFAPIRTGGGRLDPARSGDCLHNGISARRRKISNEKRTYLKF